MKRTAILLVNLLLASALSSQEVIQNPAKARNPQAGRTLVLEKVWEAPLGPQRSFEPPLVDPRGVLYVAGEEPAAGSLKKGLVTFDYVLLKFSPDGQPLGDLLQKCPDPAEFANVNEGPVIAVSRDRVCIVHKRRIIRFDADGKYLDEVWNAERTPAGYPGTIGTLLGLSSDGYVVDMKRHTMRKEPSGVDEEEAVIYLLSSDGASKDKIAGVTQRSYRPKAPGTPGFRSYRLTPLLTAFDPDTETLYVSCTREYEIAKVDVAKRKVVARFTREYQRVEPAEKYYRAEVLEQAGIPPDRYAQDILRMVVCEGYLWVETSTKFADSRSLVDVFDPEGRFIDSLVMNFSNSRPAPGGYLYVLATNDAKDWVVQKFRMLNGPKTASLPHYDSRILYFDPGAALRSIHDERDRRGDRHCP